MQRAEEKILDYASPILGQMYESIEIKALSGGYFADSVKSLQKICEEDPIARGTPQHFHHDVLFFQMMSEATDKHGDAIKEIPTTLEDEFNYLANYLKNFPNVLLIGPGDEKLWKTPNFDGPSHFLMDIICKKQIKWCILVCLQCEQWSKRIHGASMVLTRTTPH